MVYNLILYYIEDSIRFEEPGDAKLGYFRTHLLPQQKIRRKRAIIDESINLKIIPLHAIIVSGPEYNSYGL